MTNLQDFFYDKTINWKSQPIYNIFIYSHMVAIVDPDKFTISNASRGDNSIQKTLMN